MASRAAEFKCRVRLENNEPILPTPITSTMATYTEHPDLGKKSEIRPVPGTWRYRWVSLRAVLIWLSIWMAGGVAIVIFVMGDSRPKTIWGWLLYAGAAPVIYLLWSGLAEIPLLVAEKIPAVAKFGRATFSWIDRGVDSNDRILRLCVVFVGPLVLLFILARVFLVP